MERARYLPAPSHDSESFPTRMNLFFDNYAFSVALNIPKGLIIIDFYVIAGVLVSN